ncbi:hypothetical protein [Saccharopolyspora hattusasensis]|uniref:hypothetical protein n=1 Tax=Saccharopolyspora hattusasensis TaxID=1128679 RepID=UPI003D97CA77
MSRLRCLAVDFGGTLARPGPDPDGAAVAAVLAAGAHIADAGSFAAAFASGRWVLQASTHRHPSRCSRRSV